MPMAERFGHERGKVTRRLGVERKE